MTIVRQLARAIIPASLRQAIRESLAPKPGVVEGVGWDEVKDDDIYLASYPRSGNTWLRNVLTNLRFPNAQWDLFSLSVAFPEYGSSINVASIPRPRWIKTHLEISPAYRNIVYLVRDGRDVAVSFYRWSGTSLPFDEFVRTQVLRQGGPFLSWQDHVMQWTERMPPGALFVRYEDLIGENSMSELERLASAMGLTPSDEDIRRALSRSTYEKQQQDFQRHPLLKGKAVGVGAGAGKWREYFGDELHEEFWQIAGSAMSKAGYIR